MIKLVSICYVSFVQLEPLLHFQTNLTKLCLLEKDPQNRK